MTILRYIAGSAALLFALAAVVSGARALGARLLPDWTGPLGALVVGVLGIATVTVVSEALGTFGLFRIVPLTLVLVAAGLVAHRGARNITPANRSPLPAREPPLTPRAAAPIVGIAVVIVIAEWLTATVRSFQTGMTAVDAVWYHMPTAARFAQSGSTWHLHFIDTSSLTVFYPAGSELLHAVGMVFLSTDALSRVLNLGWLAVGLLAAWCIGARFRVAPVALLGAALLFATPQLVRLESGQALNDMAVTALLLAAIAVIVNAVDFGRAQQLGRTPLAIAAMAAGLAAGAKWTALVSVAALTVCIPFITRRSDRIRNFLIWIATVTVTGGYWYLRNVFAVGSPVPPQRIGIGPVHLPYFTPGIPTFSITQYLTNSGVWHHNILPGLRSDFGPVWWFVLILAIGGLAGALIAGPERSVRIRALVGAACVVSYIVTKQGFTVKIWNGTPRYAAPGLALGLALLPVAVARASRHATTVVLAAYLVALAATQFDAQLWRAWWAPSHHLAVVLSVLTVAAIAVAVFFAWRAPRPHGTARVAPIAIAAIAVVAVASGFALNSYRQTFASHGTPGEAAARVLRDRDVRHARIALTGNLLVGGAQYTFSDKRLTNYVQFVSAVHHHRARPFTDCETFVRALDAGRYDYVVAARAEAGTADPAIWLRTQPSAARQIDRHTLHGATVFEITGPLDPETCNRTS